MEPTPEGVEDAGGPDAVLESDVVKGGECLRDGRVGLMEPDGLVEFGGGVEGK